MELTVLAVPGCPNAPVLKRRLAAALVGRPVVTVPDAPVIPAAADVSCGYVNFFTTGVSAAAWASAHPHITGEILDQAAALRLGTAIFGHLLADDP